MESDLKHLGDIRFPKARGTRVQMMPFRIDDPLSIHLPEWRAPVMRLVDRAGGGSGVGFLTIDEAEVLSGETHRRPGLHTDGLGSFSPGPPSFASQAGGMIVAASDVGCRAWRQEFRGTTGYDGDCEHMRAECLDSAEVVMGAGKAYWCASDLVHECLPLAKTTRRQFLRISMPGDGSWFQGYSRNPEGIEPPGMILPPRATQMGFRS